MPVQTGRAAFKVEATQFIPGFVIVGWVLTYVDAEIAISACIADTLYAEDTIKPGLDCMASGGYMDATVYHGKSDLRVGQEEHILYSFYGALKRLHV